MQIRKVKLNEIELLLPFWEAQVNLHHKADPTYTYPLTPALSEEIYTLLENHLSNNYYEIWAAMENTEMLGFIAYRFDKTNYFYTNMNHFGEVYNILVKDTYVKQGLGKKLMQFAENKMQENNIPYAMLIASPNNQNGFAFYKHLGYVPRQSQFFKRLSGKFSPKKDIEIIPFNLEYLESLLNLWQEQVTFHYHIDNIYGKPFSLETQEILRKLIQESVEKQKSHIRLALKDGKAVGFIEYALQACDHYYTPIKQFGQVYSLYVTANHRNSGIGRALMQEAENFFVEKQLEHAMLWAMPLNKNAIAFYQQQGYDCKQVQMFKSLGNQ